MVSGLEIPVEVCAASYNHVLCGNRRQVVMESWLHNTLRGAQVSRYTLSPRNFPSQYGGGTWAGRLDFPSVGSAIFEQKKSRKERE